MLLYGCGWQTGMFRIWNGGLTSLNYHMSSGVKINLVIHHGVRWGFFATLARFLMVSTSLFLIINIYFRRNHNEIWICIDSTPTLINFLKHKCKYLCRTQRLLFCFHCSAVILDRVLHISQSSVPSFLYTKYHYGFKIGVPKFNSMQWKLVFVQHICTVI